MRIKSNKNIHQMKRDPYKVLLRMSGILAIILVVSIGIFWLCSQAVMNDYRGQRSELEKENIEAEQAFNAQLNALRDSHSRAAASTLGDVDQTDLPFWEKTVGDSLWRIEDEGYAGLENTSTLTLNRSDLILGGLLLVNPWHMLPSDFSEESLQSVGTASGYKIQVSDSSVKLFPVAFDALSAMIEDAAKENLGDYIVREAYRSNDTQTAKFNAAMEKLSSKYSGDILIEQTKKDVNYPGTSEYQTGMSFQLGLYSKTDGELKNKAFYETDQGKWFLQNAWRYGVVFRFPVAEYPTPAWEDKSYKTNVSIKLNLYRYVGKAHAVAMQVMDYCLEEYVEFLIDHPHFCIYQDGTLKYEVFRIAAEDALTYDVPVPNPASDFQASLDNMGGVVMAYSYN